MKLFIKLRRLFAKVGQVDLLEVPYIYVFLTELQPLNFQCTNLMLIV